MTNGEQPSTCVCLTSLVFLHNQGTKASYRTPVHHCSVCGVAAHFYCSQYAVRDCKCVARAGFTHVRHHWSERWVNVHDNPEISAFCFYCEEPCSVPLLDASPTWHCLWCQRLIHVRCHNKMAKECGDACDFCTLSRIIISPLCVKEVGHCNGGYRENSNIEQNFNREKQRILGEELMYSFIDLSTQYSDGFYTSLSKLCVHVSNLLTFLTSLKER
ncbi:hypothetical protein L3X38_037170 [Prunus dulcis]|uniref:Phorbol-ester/DAG-type domain-containing protein n=1 Tax=Prunus dulcis TaxID=3755 RepID=A0AAD4V366_PRUDU|nr:hypothetical protein L3X38_037170 [Prunus dulcis]